MTTDQRQELATAFRLARQAQHISKAALARKADVSRAYLTELENGRYKRPGLESLDKVAQALGFESVDRLVNAVRTGSESNVVGRVEDLRAPGAKALPVYRWGTCGDPRDRESPPDPDHERYPPVGRESMIGPNGFGVLVKGTSMTGRGINDGDIVWCNPDRSKKRGGVVLARCLDDDGTDMGVVVKVWKDSPGEVLVSDGDGDDGHAPFYCRQYEILGPVVWITREFPPG